MNSFNSSSLDKFTGKYFNIGRFNATLKSILSAKLLIGLARRIKAHKEMQHLRGLDNRMLKDIGLQRSDLAWAMRQADQIDPLTALQVRRENSLHEEHLAAVKAFCVAQKN